MTCIHAEMGGDSSRHCSCVAELRQEVERLRAQRVLSNEDFARSFDMGLAAGERRERAAVVTWLRTLDDRWGLGASVCGGVAHNMADAIERGEHRREEEP